MRVIPNSDARRFFLYRHGLSGPSDGAGVAGTRALIGRLGFVQVDSIRTVERAHHMILSARRKTYRQRELPRLIERERAFFENWTHDASVIPVEFFPMWRAAMRDRAPAMADRWRRWQRDGFEEQAHQVCEEIARRGPCMTREMGADEDRTPGGWWTWNPSKIALEWAWRTGALCIARREGFQKVYDLTENVIPAEHLTDPPPRAALIDWACGAALDRLGFGTPGEIARFFDVISPAEAKAWAAGRNDLEEVAITGADGAARTVLMRASEVGEVAKAPAAPGGVRVLSPFDPAIRDRTRARRLFGFDYTIEVFTPEAKRRYGYYVFPLLEGEKLIGRIDMKAARAADALHVTALWLEPGVRAGAGRMKRLEAELDRQRRFAGVARVTYEQGWIR